MTRAGAGGAAGSEDPVTVDDGDIARLVEPDEAGAAPRDEDGDDELRAAAAAGPLASSATVSIAGGSWQEAICSDGPMWADERRGAPVQFRARVVTESKLRFVGIEFPHTTGKFTYHGA